MANFSKQKLNVAVVGGGLGGLSAAIHLRLAGFPVTIYEANERVGGRVNVIVCDGYRFDIGPSLLNYPWVYEELFSAAGRSFHDYVQLIPVDPSLSFRWPDGTSFTLSSRLDQLLAQTENIEPGSRPAVLDFMRDASARYDLAFAKLIQENCDHPLRWFGSLTLREIIRIRLWCSLYSELGRYFSSHYLKEALGSYGMYLGGSPFHLPGFFSILPYAEMAYGLWLPRGGMYSLVEGIERLAKEIGVEIRTGHRVRHIEIAARKTRGLQLENGSLVESSLVVSNVDVPTTETQLIRKEVNLKKRRGQNQRLAMTPGVLTIYWGIRKKIECLGHHTIFLPTNYKRAFHDLFSRGCLPDDLPFYVSLPSATDPELAPPDCTAMFILAPAPLLSQWGSVNWDFQINQLKSRVLERLKHHGLKIHPEDFAVEKYLTPQDWQSLFGLYDGSAFGAAHTLFQLGPFRPRNYSQEVSGLYYVGASTTPGTGVPMVVISGKLTAKRILSNVHKAIW